MDTKISIAMCTYNGEKYIKEQLVSILAQSRIPDEIVICDDNSSDNTIHEIKEVLNLIDIEWKLIINSKNIGVSKNYEKALSLCTGDIIFTCDQDDVWIINKIEKVESVFARNPNCILVFSDAELVDSKLENMNLSLWETYGLSNHLLKKVESNCIIDLLLKENKITGATMAFRKKLLVNIIPISENWVHDYWIAIIASINGQLIGIQDKLILYRQHNDNVIGAKRLKFLTKIKIYFENFHMLKEIRYSKFIMLSDLLEQIEVNEQDILAEYLHKIKKCYIFWNRKMELNYEHNLHCFDIILVDMITGSYGKYYTGFRGFVRDLISLFLPRHK